MKNSYTIRHHEHGTLILDAMPLFDVEILNFLAELYEYNLFDKLIAEKYNANFCLTTKEKSKLWREELDINEQ